MSSRVLSMPADNRTIWLSILVVALLGAVLIGTKGQRVPDSDEIEYRGEFIQLSDSYSDYDDFKNDPNNIAPYETQRVQRLVSTATLPRTYSSWNAVIREVMDLKFPGYGLSSDASHDLPDGSTLFRFGVEIPRAGKDRCLMFLGRDGRYELIDDFIQPEAQMIIDFRVDDGKILYTSFDDEVVRNHPIPKH